MIPDGYRRLRYGNGVSLYRKNAIFVQVVNLDHGASVQLLHGAVTDWRPGRGVWGGNDAKFKFHRLLVYWRYIRQRFPGAFSVVNGAFWKVGQEPATLALPLKAGGEILTEGFMYNAIPQRVNMLEIWEDHAEINELNKDAFYSSDAPFIIGGRNFNANLRKMSFTGRTMVGVSAGGETLYILSSRSARQNEGYKILRKFGADRITMLDSGGSSQMIAGGITLVWSSRSIPQVLAVIGAK